MIKNQDFLEKIAAFCIDKSKKRGATNSNVYVSNSISETVNFRNRQLDESDRSDSLALSLTIYINKKKSNISSSNLSKENLEKLIEKCIETTKITPEDELNSLPDKNLLAKDIKDLNLYDEKNYDNDKKIEYLKEVEESVFKKEKIINSESSFSEKKSNFILANSDGFLKGYKTSSFSAFCVAVSKSNGSMERDYEYTNKCHLEDMMKSSKLGEIAAKKAINKLNPKKIKSTKIPIIFDKRLSKGILNVLSSAIFASSISRNTSFLKDRLNTEIFNRDINITDKPDILKGLGSKPFDTEGVQSNELNIVEDGILKNYLIDTYYGKKLNLQSNGRAGGTTNLFFENGNLDFKELLKSNNKILYVTETIGHGSNIVTGDYSVGASGFLVENGEFLYPVNEITIAGNFKQIFKNITLANDLEFKYSTNAPTALLEGLTVAGK